MKRALILAAALMVTTAAAASAQGFFENWESGTISAPWTFYGAGNPQVSVVTEQNATPGGQYSLKYPGGAANYAAGLNRTVTNGFSNWTVSFKFYDAGPNTGMRSYLQMQSYAGGGTSGSLLQLISFGAYNSTVDTSVYNMRIVTGGPGWTNTTVKRSQGWHSFKVVASNNSFTFFCDDAPGVTTAGTVVPITNFRVGSGLTTNGVDSYFDDICYVPEPSSMLALASGLAGLAGLVRRRRA